MFFLVLGQMIVFASSPYQYGDTLLKYDMNSSLSSSDFWYLYKGKGAAEISSEKTYNGGKGLKVDASKIRNSTEGVFNFHTFKLSNKFGIDHSSLFFEFFIWGMGAEKDNFSFYPYFDYPNGTTKQFKTMMNFESPDENGWTRVWALIPRDVYGDFESCYMAVMYTPRSTDTPIDFFYLDDMSIRIIPSELYIQDVTAKNSVDLNTVRVFGVNDIGEKKKIETYQYMRWSVVEGDGMISNGVLTGSGDVVVRCSYFGMSYDFTVHFNGQHWLSYSELKKNPDGSCEITVINESQNPTDVMMIFTLFNGKRLYSAQTISKTVPAAASACIRSEEITIPSRLSAPQVKIFCWNNTDGFTQLDNYTE
jgi:hypothetical protein